MPYAIYIASVLGAIALLLMMPRKGYNPRLIGTVVGAATLGGFWLYLSRFLPAELGIAKPALIFYYIFSAIAIGSAVRVITHTKPVFSALWFVMLVVATAGLFLILNAEFIAFAMVIIYGGAILVTYVFVIMLASQAGDPERTATAESPEYDRIAREPAAAIAAGFLLLAMLLTVAFTGVGDPNRDAAADPAMMEAQLARTGSHPGQAAASASDETRAMVSKINGPAGPHPLENVEGVGLDLFQSHPLGLELAGIILLVSLIGAVVIARKQVDGPEETLPPPTGTRPTHEPGPHSAETLTATQAGSQSAG